MVYIRNVDVCEICITIIENQCYNIHLNSLLLCGMTWIYISILGLSAVSEMELKVTLCIHDQLEHVVAHLVEALRCKPEGHRFNSCWFHWNFSSTLSFQPRYSPCVDSASNRNECQEYFLGNKGGRCVGLTTLPPSCAECHEIWELHPPGTLRACPGL